jgi:hypothetical protein
MEDSFYETGEGNSMRGEAWRIGEWKLIVEFTVHRGAAEVLGSEG